MARCCSKGVTYRPGSSTLRMNMVKSALFHGANRVNAVPESSKMEVSNCSGAQGPEMG